MDFETNGHGHVQMLCSQQRATLAARSKDVICGHAQSSEWERITQSLIKYLSEVELVEASAENDPRFGIQEMAERLTYGGTR